MAQVNFARKEISCKIVYYGPGMSGKTTNIEMVFKKTADNNKGQLTSIATEGDRTLFFDYLPLDIGKIGGLNIKLQLYTVPGQIYYNSTRRLVLQGADGVVFVADSQPDKEKENIESIQNLEDNLKAYQIELKTLPYVIQFNKRDLPGVLEANRLNTALNKYNAPTFEATAIKGEGVFPTLKAISKLVLDKLNREYFTRTPDISETRKEPVKAEIGPTEFAGVKHPVTAPPSQPVFIGKETKTQPVIVQSIAATSGTRPQMPDVPPVKPPAVKSVQPKIQTIQPKPPATGGTRPKIPEAPQIKPPSPNPVKPTIHQAKGFPLTYLILIIIFALLMLGGMIMLFFNPFH